MPDAEKRKPGRPRSDTTKLREENLELRDEMLKLKEKLHESETALIKSVDERVKMEMEIKALLNDKYKKLGAQVIERVRKHVFKKCCGRKAYLKICETLSCRHLLALCAELEAALVEDGVFQPVRYERPRFEDKGKEPSGRMDYTWQTVALDEDRGNKPLGSVTEAKLEVKVPG